MLATTPTLPLDQGDPVAFVRVHASQVCLRRHPSIDYQLALAVIRGPSNPVLSSWAIAIQQSLMSVHGYSILKP